MVGGFFPTPYPDECYYSVLCRYFIRSGNTSYKRATRKLFGNMQCLLFVVNDIFPDTVRMYRQLDTVRIIDYTQKHCRLSHHVPVYGDGIFARFPGRVGMRNEWRSIGIPS
jgi:hypothetical protein